GALDVSRCGAPDGAADRGRARQRAGARRLGRIRREDPRAPGARPAELRAAARGHRTADSRPKAERGLGQLDPVAPGVDEGRSRRRADHTDAAQVIPPTPKRTGPYRRSSGVMFWFIRNMLPGSY